jgi:MFS family permease
LGLLPWHVGVLLSANRFIRIFINHWAERLCRGRSLSALFVLSLFGGALLTSVYALFSSFVVLLSARLLWGLCWTFIRQIGLTTIAESSERGREGLAMGWYSGLSRLGSVAGNFLGALGHDLLGFSTLLLSFSALSLMAAPLGWLGCRGERAEVVLEVDEAERKKAEGRLLFGGFSIGFVGHGAIMSTLGLVLMEKLGQGIEIAGVFIGVATLTGALMASRWIADLTAPFMGSLCDRFGRAAAALFFFGAGALVLLVAAASDDLTLLIACILFFFFCATGASVALVSEVGIRGPRSLASYVTAADLGACAGPLVGWQLPQWELPMWWIYLSGALMYALAALAFRWRRAS